MKQPKPGFMTRSIHGGYEAESAQGALNPPVHFSSTYVFDSAAKGAKLFEGEEEGYIYSRLGTPTTATLEARLASLENGEAALVTASGMGAIASTMWSLLNAGDEVLASPTLYGSTHAFFEHHLTRFGIQIQRMQDSSQPSIEQQIHPKTRLIYLETPANPNLKLTDISHVAALAKRHGIPLIVDNTFATPYLTRPLDLGATLVVHSATKYLGGHGDLLGGAVIGQKDWIDKIRQQGLKDCTGASLGAMDAMLLMRGLKTLRLRVKAHSASATEIAHRLANHSALDRLMYPHHPSHPDFELAQKQMRLGGGMLSLDLKGGTQAAQHFMDRLELIQCAVSLGDAESLVQHPATMTHSTYSDEELAASGITPGQVRISIGLEDPKDLLEDLLQALK